jgi:hypothetical protein
MYNFLVFSLSGKINQPKYDSFAKETNIQLSPFPLNKLLLNLSYFNFNLK